MPKTTVKKKIAMQPPSAVLKPRASITKAVRKQEPFQPYCVPTTHDWQPASKLRFKRAKNPMPRGTLGDFGVAVEVMGPDEFPETLLVQPYEARVMIGIDATSVRIFRWDERAQTLLPVWNSGNNATLGFVWSKIRRSGVYVALGLPRDRLLLEAFQEMARSRRLVDTDSLEEMQAITQHALEIFMKPRDEDLDELRQFITQVEIQTGLGQFSKYEIRRRGGAHILPLPLPGDVTIKEFRARLTKLETSRGGLPEEMLLFPPEVMREGEPPWARPDTKWDGVDQRVLDRIRTWIDPQFVTHIPPWFFSQDWWMYHHDAEHTGHASGSIIANSDINSCNVGRLFRKSKVLMDGEVFSIPCIVDGKVYVGTGHTMGGGTGGSLCRIDLAACGMPGYTPEVLYSVTPQVGGGAGQGDGIGSSPAIVANHAYFCSTDGRVFCWDINNNYLAWSTNLRYSDLVHNQPVNNPLAACWTSPLVVNGKVYVGCGEGERGAFGFVFCLDANTGHVIWLFCTNQFSNAVDNSPNVIPSSTVSGSLPAGFSSQPDPLNRGASVWSSCAYDASLDRIYVGTGNPYADTPLPNPKYASGILSLDATTGQFRAFYQPLPSDSYYLSDNDVDVPGSPTVFTVGGRHVVGIGSKNGSYHVLDADTLNRIAARQLLPYDAVTGLPLPNVDPNGSDHENLWGVFGTAAVDWSRGVLFVGLGGYEGIDVPTTPFIRALDWNTLSDAWPTTIQSVGVNHVSRYSAATPPLYTTNEAGLSSPAVVNDVVFVSTTKPGLYALDTATGVCLWSAPGLSGSWALGPAIYGNYVVIGVGDSVYIYTFARPIIHPQINIDPRWLWLYHNLPWPPPPPDPFTQE